MANEEQLDVWLASYKHFNGFFLDYVVALLKLNQ